MNDLLDKLELIYQRWLQIGEEITKPDIMSDMKNYVKLSKDYKELQAVVDAYKRYKDVIDNIASAKDILANEKDEEFREMAKAELDAYQSEKETLEEEIRLLLLPSDPQDSKNAQMEIRAGTGGDEASIFAGDLFRMYQHFCDNKGWKIEVLSMTEGTVGGYKEIDFSVTGNGVYGIMKYESGVHRVQRVPQTESQGRNPAEYYRYDLSNNYKMDDSEEEAPCPYLSETGCVLSADEKPWDCKIWPLRVMKKDGEIVIALTPTCPEINKMEIAEVQKFVEENLKEDLFSYAEAHPYLVKKYHEGFPVLAVKQ